MKTKTKVAFGTLIFCGALMLGFGVSADTILTDNFNSYNLGSLNGQGGWIDASGTFTVQNSTVFEGTNAVKIDTAGLGFTVKKQGASLNDGLQTIYVRRSGVLAKGQLLLYEGDSLRVLISLQNANSGKFSYFAGGAYYDFGNFNADTWYAVQVQWRSSDHKVRYNINGGAWTAYDNPLSAWSNGLDTVAVQELNQTGGALYFDAIQENPTLVAKTPVLIVPGLTGTNLIKDNNLLWLNSFQLGQSFTDSFMDPLAFNQSLSSSDPQIFASDVIRSQGGLDYTDGLITDLKNQGYIENETLFTFPYDWRYGVTGKYTNGKTNVDLLQQRIADILQQTGAQKIDVIAHSMGGLITKQYVRNHVADNHIGKAVFVGVPSTGAPYAVKDLLVGDNLGSPFVNQDEIKKISANMPAIYDLLPSQQYYNQKGSYVKVIDQGTLGEGPVTIKDLNYGETNSFLGNDHQLNTIAVTNAGNLHTQSFDNFDLRTAGVDLYAIDGCKTGTLGTVIEERYKNALGQSFTDYKRPKMTPGDGTVPLESATNLPVDSGKKYYALTGEHAKLMSQDGTRQEIVNLLSESALAVDPRLVTQDITKCNLNGKAISVFSPVDIAVHDQSGNTLGLATDGSIVNTIPNADFEIWGEHKFVYLPTDDGQTYAITIDGTATGTYTIKDDDIVDGATARTQVFSNLPVTADLLGTINLDGSQDTLTVNQQTILPSSTVAGDATQDVLPPVSTTTLTGTQGQAGFYRSDVNVVLNATDDSSGVLSVNYKIDGGSYVSVAAASANFTVSAEGPHTITYFATDNAGNNESEKTMQFTVDKTAPEATMNFDQSIKDLRFVATDNISTSDKVIIFDGGNHVTLTDEAGNVLDIGFAQINRKSAMKASIQSLSYNGQMANLNTNTFSDSWTLDKQGLLKSLTQSVQSRPNYSIKAVYDGAKTTLTGADQTGKINKTIVGLAVLKVASNKGDFSWSY